MVTVLLAVTVFAQDAEPTQAGGDPGDYQTSLDGDMDYGTVDYAGDMYGGGYGCGYGDVCNPCAGVCDGVYNGCGYGYGCGFCVGNGCFAGVVGLVGGAVQLALTPVHWVAGLLSCGTYGDCGCAPLPYRVYRDPCDNCGNWIGGGECGGCATCGGPNGIGGGAYGTGVYGTGAYGTGGYGYASSGYASGGMNFGGTNFGGTNFGGMNFGNDGISTFGKNSQMGRRPSSRMIVGEEVIVESQPRVIEAEPRRGYRAAQEPVFSSRPRGAQLAENAALSNAAPNNAMRAGRAPVRARRIAHTASRPTALGADRRGY